MDQFYKDILQAMFAVHDLSKYEHLSDRDRQDLYVCHQLIERFRRTPEGQASFAAWNADARSIKHAA